ncbi:hypothetical protein PTSG_11888 [Salpingoeca rosetta]|uniref:Uncharacterized protein n=1 Tax=Salpingoeca rosetta (strain ATCC 50818 / BSB-021) TaxID=946362 RepID=F2U2G5_SALR5|nr:uncharacterized protein PTSG_11888 [Salpingoeca rosetta]EGD81817.1 hypothetical protein PTSG_11888 [Salpingoeca rosetta]|eukprot:XP_004997021.1 hypothetical protein PTSG_11888 [Salpingoeca rosetta]
MSTKTATSRATMVLPLIAVLLAGFAIVSTHAIVQNNDWPSIPLPENLALRLHATPSGGYLSTADIAEETGMPVASNLSLADPSVLGNIPAGTDPLDIVPIMNYNSYDDMQAWDVELAPLSVYAIARFQAGEPGQPPQIQLGTSCPGLFRLGANEDGLLFADTCIPGLEGATRTTTNIRVTGGITFIAVAFNAPTKVVGIYVNSTRALREIPHDGSSTFPELRLGGPLQVSDIIAHSFAYTDQYVNALNTHFWNLFNNGRRPDAAEVVPEDELNNNDDNDGGEVDDDAPVSTDDDEVMQGGGDDDAPGDGSDTWTTCVGGLNIDTNEACGCAFGCAKCLLPPSGTDESQLCVLCSSNTFILHQGECLLDCPEGFDLLQSGDDGKKTCRRTGDGSAASSTTASSDLAGDANGNGQNNSSSGSVPLDDKAIIGIAVGLVLLAMVIAIVAFAVNRRSKHRRKRNLLSLQDGFLDN